MPLTRRALLAGVASASACRALGTLRVMQVASAQPRVNPGRLRQALEQLSVYGRPTGGTFADGVSRVAYSDADLAGRNYAMQRLRDADLQPRIDAAGNILAVRPGKDPSLKPILFGSHIDSVPAGGNFDGDLGSMAALEIMLTLRQNAISTRHPLQLVFWSNEEGGLVGSRAAVGELSPGDLSRVAVSGFTLAQGIARIGGDPARIAEARLGPSPFHCYLELHIEQGGTLAKAGIPIGVVEGIVSIDEYNVEIRGFANHAGTTPMPERRNALLAAARLIDAVQEVVTRQPGRQVGTVGRLQVFPNAPNVVPGLVKHTIELRDLSPDRIAALGQEIRRRSDSIARATNTEILITQVEHDPPAVATPAIQSAIEKAAANLGLRTMRLPSGAGHDAQMMARLGPMGMIFVPSVGGISHSPREFTAWQDCAQGADVLLHTILALDQS